MNKLRLVVLLVALLSTQASIIRKPEVQQQANVVSQVAENPAQPVRSTVEQASAVIQPAENPVQPLLSKVEQANVVSQVGIPVQPARSTLEQTNVVSQVAGIPVQSEQSKVEQANVVSQAAEIPVQSKKEEQTNVVSQVAEIPLQSAPSKEEQANVVSQLAAQANIVAQAVGIPLQPVRSTEEQANEVIHLAENPVQPEQSKVEQANKVSHVVGIPVQPEQSRVEQATVVSQEAKNPEQAVQSNVEQANKVIQLGENPAQANEVSQVAEIPPQPALSQVSNAANVVAQDVPQIVHQQKQEEPKLSHVVAMEVKAQQAQASNVVPKAAAAPVQSQAPTVVATEQPEEKPVANKETQTVQEQATNEISKNEIPEQVVVKVEGTGNPVVNKAQAEGRTKYELQGGEHYPEEFFIIDTDPVTANNTNTTAKPPNNTHIHNHSHDHHYIQYKPSLFPLPPPLFAGFVPQGSGSGSYHTDNKYDNGNVINPVPPYGGGNVHHSYGKPGYISLPLLPIPFWKPQGGGQGGQVVNYTDPHQTEQLYNKKPYYYNGAPYYDPSEFYIHERRAPEGQDQQQGAQGAPNQQALQLIGHIFIYKTPETGPAQPNPKPAVPVASDDNTKKSEGSPVKIDEKVGSSQLLLQPVLYAPTNNKEEGGFSPNQIHEIYRSLHLVQPSSQQRSQAPEANDDSSVLFAVEIPKPIYRFFKSIAGVFTY
ncbi:uncharacterized protein [Drosophila virilis]|uniref:uncharacterized protein n=1 Tax=Drosophila virilis TaxID=7244 RepID=UPI00017D2F1F